MPRASASAASTRRSDMPLGGSITTPKGRRRPSQFTKVPARSCISDTGKTTSARSVTSDARVSKLIRKSTASNPSSAPCGSAKSFGSTPATTSAFSSASAAAIKISSASRPSSDGSDSIPQVAWVSTRAAASATGLPPGSRLGKQPASTAARSPARRGTQASLAPVRSASR